MDGLDFIPTAVFEAVGSCIGGFAIIVISMQILAEWRSDKCSSLSYLYILGFLFIYLFWTIYGVRFRLVAVGYGNFVATLLQAGLFVLVWYKNRRLSSDASGA